jgi:hypothetical protein
MRRQVGKPDKAAEEMEMEMKSALALAVIDAGDAGRREEDNTLADGNQLLNDRLVSFIEKEFFLQMKNDVVISRF